VALDGSAAGSPGCVIFTHAARVQLEERQNLLVQYCASTSSSFVALRNWAAGELYLASSVIYEDERNHKLWPELRRNLKKVLLIWRHLQQFSKNNCTFQPPLACGPIT
jgi:hypothetical protein